MIKAVRRKGESVERLIGQWKRRFQSTGLLDIVRSVRYRKKKPSRRAQRLRAVYNAKRKKEMERLLLYE